MTTWKCAIAVLPFALVLFGATPQSPGYAAYERANALFVAKKFPEALAATEEALRLDPKLVPALTLKAKLAMAAYRLDVARQCLEQALAIDPRAPYAQFLYGLEAYLGNDAKEALPRFRKARQLNPNDPRAALYLGLTLESLGQTAGGVVSLRRGGPPGTFRGRTACGDVVAWRKAPSSAGPPGGMRALDPPSPEAIAEFARRPLRICAAPAEEGRCGPGRRRRRDRARLVGGSCDGRGDPLSADSSLPAERNAGSGGDSRRNHACTGNAADNKAKN